MSAFFDLDIGRTWRNAPQDPSVWTRIGTAADTTALWSARIAQRARLLERIERSLREDGPGGLSAEITADRALVIGFARRFATYKRAGLLLQEPERLARLLTNTSRPGVLVFAGKAHPHDEPG